MVSQVLFLAALMFCLFPNRSPSAALFLGCVLGITTGQPWPVLGKHLSKWLLQGCVVMLGFGMDFAVVLRAGLHGALFAAGTIALTLLLGVHLGRWLKLGRTSATLISAGTAICGGSAIAAVGSVIGAEEGDMTVAMGTVFLLNGLALYLFPIIGNALHLSDQQFGTWAGVAIHDLSSVVGAAGRFGLPALQTATAVKLSRVLWIIPLAVGLAWTRNHRAIGAGDSTVGFDPAQATPRKLQFPLFIAFFLLASLGRSFAPAIAPLAPVLTQLARVGLTVALFLIGASISRKTLQAVGWRAVVHGSMLWVVIGTVSLVFVRWG